MSAISIHRRLIIVFLFLAAFALAGGAAAASQGSTPHTGAMSYSSCPAMSYSACP